jgi:RimJ/RimL family protein N-acetyltransferase
MPQTVAWVVAKGTMSGAVQPVIEMPGGEVLRPFEDSHFDAEAVVRAFSDADVQMWHGFAIAEVSEATEWIRGTHSKWRDETAADWAVVNAAGAMLGGCGLHTDLRFGTAEITYWMLPDARGNGVALRAVNALTEWAHESLGMHRIELGHSTQNARSCSVANRAGYRAEGTARQQFLHVDGWHDIHLHGHVVGDT